MSDQDSCKTCAHRSPALAYPMLFCELRHVLVQQNFVCAKYQGAA